jgi:beta-galactosidase
MAKTIRINSYQNNDWKFIHGDYPEAKEASYDDSSWYDIGIPYSFGICKYWETGSNGVWGSFS